MSWEDRSESLISIEVSEPAEGQEWVAIGGEVQQSSGMFERAELLDCYWGIGGFFFVCISHNQVVSEVTNYRPGGLIRCAVLTPFGPWTTSH